MKVDNTVLEVLSNAQTEDCHLRLVGSLDRKLYEKTNKVLEAAGGKWNRKEKAHVFEGDASDAIEQIILTGEITIPQNFGFFPTPNPVVARLIELAEIEPGMAFLEPSAGMGNIAYELAKHGSVHCIELLTPNIEALTGTLSSVQQADFLEVEPEPKYDRVVMNPPFAKQADIKHVLHAFKFLKPGGRLVSVMSAGVTFRQDRLTQEFRTLVLASKGLIEELPDAAFKESGTLVKTVIVAMEAQPNA